MANRIIPKKSSVAAKVPLATDLSVGEIAINLVDKKIYSKDSGGTVIELANGTVTSVSGTGTASGLTLSGTVTTSGNLTLSGTVNALAAGTYGISISGNAATATTASAAPWSGITSKPTTLSGYGITDALALSGGALTGGLREAKVAMAANDINLTSGNYFTKTISTATTLTVSNVPATGTVAAFVLDLTNGGAGTITWWAGMKWVAGTAPTLTASGRDVLAFFTHDGGTTWSGFVLGKDVK